MLDQEAKGTVVAAAKQWWLKVNRKPVRGLALDGAVFPYIIKVCYTVDGREYTKRKWIDPGRPVPSVGSAVRVLYSAEKPAKAKIL